jgi:lipoprotein-anchoring transpeptidase ErfK/SrfK
MKGRRHRKHVTRKRLYTLITAFILIVIPQIVMLYTVYPNTIMGGIRLDLTSIRGTRNKLGEIVMMPQRISVLNREYSLSYQDLGVTVDEQAAVDTLFIPNRQPFPKNVISFLKSFRSVRAVPTPLVFTDRYDRFVNSLVLDGSEGNDSLTVDEITKTFVYHELGKRYVIDSADLKRLLTDSFGTGSLLVPKLKKLPNPTKYVIEDINRKLTEVYANPLELEFTIGNKSYKAVITAAELRDVTGIIYSDEIRRPLFTLNRTRLLEILRKRQTIAQIPESRPIPLPETTANVLSAMTQRFDGAVVPHVSVPLDKAKTSLGKLAPKYVEVDLAKQELYAYAYGNLIKTYVISSGAEYPTPTGWFKILNKAPNAFSTIYNVFMPYWMAFGYSGEHDAYFGFHELAYAVTETGERLERTRDAIGVPSTGGCVALDIGDAKEFYTFAEIGTPIYIYN